MEENTKNSAMGAGALTLGIISIISVFTTFFYNNVDEIGKEVDPSQEITRFNSFFVSDINKSNISVLECNKDQNYIIFSIIKFSLKQ